ncbi:hypothetical protein RHMOL_Rhmol06G0176400 [Rhododendron molle]|uniref:Uncharacterized protein n=1 Tax=Rhododendron molle TaxID=49168 RepID=A0ACC0ND95_RHOML|nr:hypothetical protein RHMOL_Rhmol06G0176400 [Rhododendron molle]
MLLVMTTCRGVHQLGKLEFHCKSGSLKQPMAYQLKKAGVMATPNETYDGVEEGYECSRDEISFVSSYNPTKENLHTAFGSSLSFQSSVGRFSNPDASYLKERTSIHSYMPLPQLSVAEVLYHSGGAENFIRGRSYNIRLDDQVLLRFSPKSSDSSYYFSDMIGGTLTFFNEEGSRRCLELSITLEMSETINRRFEHPSRRHSPTITKFFKSIKIVVSGGMKEVGKLVVQPCEKCASYMVVSGQRRHSGGWFMLHRVC